MNKKIFVSALAAFALAFGAGACTAPEIESCESYRESRDACEAANGMYEPVNFDLCNNVDRECKEFYDCGAPLACYQFKSGKWNLGKEKTTARFFDDGTLVPEDAKDYEKTGSACNPRALGVTVEDDPNCGKKCCPLESVRTACPQPEDKECTDDDLRVLIETDEDPGEDMGE